MQFSIITCTYNSEKYIQKNIDSVKNQTCNDFEHIFIDGFSSDNTIQIIKNYQKKFPKKIKIFQFHPEGIANAMNDGIKKSQGKYLIHLHSDDSFYSENNLKDIHNFIKEKNEPDWIYGKAKFINIETKNSRIIPHRKIYQKARFWLLLLTNYIPHQAIFIKKSIFEKYGYFDNSLKSLMDYEYWLRLTKNKVRSVFINKIICNFSSRKDSQSRSGKKNVGKEFEKVFNVYLKSKLIKLFLLFLTNLNNKRKLIK